MPRVLVADDDPVSLRFLCDACAALGADCEPVRDGRTALARATATRYDLLVFDLRLPGLDGAAVLTRLRADPAAASHRSRALAHSGELEPATRRRLLEIGFDDAWRKPVPLAALEAALTRNPTPAPAPVSAPVADAGPANVLDDTVGLAATGSGDVLSALRALFRDELPLQLAALVAAVARNDRAAARGIVHRLNGGCRFCGAMRLLNALGRVDDLLALPARVAPDALHAVETEIAAVLDQIRSQNVSSFAHTSADATAGETRDQALSSRPPRW